MCGREYQSSSQHRPSGVKKEPLKKKLDHDPDVDEQEALAALLEPEWQPRSFGMDQEWEPIFSDKALLVMAIFQADGLPLTVRQIVEWIRQKLTNVRYERSDYGMIIWDILRSDSDFISTRSTILKLGGIASGWALRQGLVRSLQDMEGSDGKPFDPIQHINHHVHSQGSRNTFGLHRPQTFKDFPHKHHQTSAPSLISSDDTSRRISRATPEPRIEQYQDPFKFFCYTRKGAQAKAKRPDRPQNVIEDAEGRTKIYQTREVQPKAKSPNQQQHLDKAEADMPSSTLASEHVQRTQAHQQEQRPRTRLSMSYIKSTSSKTTSESTQTTRSGTATGVPANATLEIRQTDDGEIWTIGSGSPSRVKRYRGRGGGARTILDSSNSHDASNVHLTSPSTVSIASSIVPTSPTSDSTTTTPNELLSLRPIITGTSAKLSLATGVNPTSASKVPFLDEESYQNITDSPLFNELFYPSLDIEDSTSQQRSHKGEDGNRSVRERTDGYSRIAGSEDLDQASGKDRDDHGSLTPSVLQETSLFKSPGVDENEDARPLHAGDAETPSSRKDKIDLWPDHIESKTASLKSARKWVDSFRTDKGRRRPFEMSLADPQSEETNTLDDVLRSLEQAKSVDHLAQVAFMFVPLSFAFSFLSMSVNVLESETLLWISVLLALWLGVLAYVARKSLQSRLSRTFRQQTKEPPFASVQNPTIQRAWTAPTLKYVDCCDGGDLKLRPFAMLTHIPGCTSCPGQF
jgi:hypothetical protein